MHMPEGHDIHMPEGQYVRGWEFGKIMVFMQVQTDWHFAVLCCETARCDRFPYHSKKSRTHVDDPCWSINARKEDAGCNGGTRMARSSCMQVNPL